MNNDNRHIILAESSRLMKQLGNRVLLSLYARVREVEALSRTVEATVAKLPKDPVLFKLILPSLIDFQGDLQIAGGGIWYEPYRFFSDQERRSFFWGRNKAGRLEYFDDYNLSDAGYHTESWYVVGRYLRPGQCFWSVSYIDQHSCQPMITCTTPMIEQREFLGAVTIDLKLEGFQADLEKWQVKTGGYLFILDRHNRFITFPDPSVVKPQIQPAHCQEEFILASDLAAREPLFSPIAIAVQEMNQKLLHQAQQAPNYQNTISSDLIARSDRIHAQDAELIAAIMVDPFGGVEATSYLHQRFELANDFLMQEACTAYLFHVPGAYWKLILVKPFTEAAKATYSILQSERMSSLGQVVAGVVHEVNNPVNFIYGNLGHAENYIQELLKLVNLYQRAYPTATPEIQAHLKASDFDFLIEDLPKILGSMRVGADRIRQIMLSLRNFSRLDEEQARSVNLHQGLDGTLLLLESRLKPRNHRPGVQVIKDYGTIPLITCYPGPLNQVFMNLLINALDAMEEKSSEERFSESAAPAPIQPQIQIQTQAVGDRVLVKIADNGRGIPEPLHPRLFEPFVTTKPTGKGTGLGLAICRQIIVEQHKGNLWFTSAPGEGTEFWIELPVHP